MQTRQYVRRVLVGGTMLVALTAAVLSTANAHDDEPQALLARLNHLTTLEADFAQQVTDAQGELVQQLHGHLALARPNLLYWQSDAPDEMVMVADGQNLWYYNPFVEQVTIYQQQNAIAQSPLLLLLDGTSDAWEHYEIKVEGASFALQPLPSASSAQSLQLVFAEHGSPAQLTRIILDDGQGQISTIELENVTLNQPVDKQLFTFKVPAGVDVDDQR